MENTELLQQFIATFSSTHIRGIELRVSSAEVRQFLSDCNSSLSFRAFNRLTGCLGCTTGNLYAYSIPALQSTSSTGGTGYLGTLGGDSTMQGLSLQLERIQSLVNSRVFFWSNFSVSDLN